MTDDIIGTIAVAAAGLALVAAGGVLLRAWLRSREKRRRLATAYYDASQATLTHAGRTVPVQNPAFAQRVWPRPMPSANNPASFAPPRRRDTPVEPLRPAYSSRRTDDGYTAPTFPADPSPVVFGDPVSLSSTSFEGDGGSFGGAGASGGWDAPSSGDNGGGYSGDSGGSSDSGSSGGDSGGGSSSD